MRVRTLKFCLLFIFLIKIKSFIMSSVAILLHANGWGERVRIFGQLHEIYDLLETDNIHYVNLQDNYKLWYNDNDVIDIEKINHEATRLVFEFGITNMPIYGKALLIRYDGDENMIDFPEFPDVSNLYR